MEVTPQLGSADPAVKKKKKKVKKPIPVTSTQFLAWEGDCTGSGILAAAASPNPDHCALFFPELGSTYKFSSTGPTAFKLDGAKPIKVDFSLFHEATVAADFKVDVTATVAGKEMTVATGTVTITAAQPESSTPMHYEMKPDAAANGQVLSNVAVTVTWENGVSFSTMELEGGDAPVVIHGFK